MNADTVSFYAAVEQARVGIPSLTEEQRLRLYGLRMVAQFPGRRPMSYLCPCKGIQLWQENEAWKKAQEDTKNDPDRARALFMEGYRKWTI
jgi:hypothetical protein